MIKAVIIDDEPLAIDELKLILEKQCGADIDVIAATSLPREGKSLVERHQPDLVFIDIEMPGMTGIEVMRSFEDPKFRVVFTSSSTAHAVEAFELCAVDYLLKPVGGDKVIRAVQKIKDEIKKQAVINLQLQKMEKQLRRHLNNENKIGVSSADKIIFVPVFEILYCEAHGSYTNIYFRDGKKILATRPLGDFEFQLSTQHFFRIHHSILINLNHVKEFQRNEGGNVMMENNKRLEVSQRKRKGFLEAIDDFIL